ARLAKESESRRLKSEWKWIFSENQRVVARGSETARLGALGEAKRDQTVSGARVNKPTAEERPSLLA
ncbi:hypothetical protein A2U01_0079921, partial [Trifolium medium]|nr:hypothetical protein [Trifolium medium]